MGTSYARLLPSALEANRSIVAMLQLSLALHYEWAPFQAQHRFPFEPAFRAQRLCRHLLNVLAGLAILQDSHEVRGGTAWAACAGILCCTGCLPCNAARFSSVSLS